VATILLCGVDLYFRGKLEGMLPGLRAAHAAGFDQVIAKSALVERCTELVDELVAT
jgi:hypothetical protein